jgi:pimeloyl-ACP methyl ester carboxylesterase
MQRSYFGRLAVVVLAGVAMGLWPHAIRAQGKVGKDKVKFETFDKVELHGTFYSGNNGKKSPTIILLHEIGSNSQKAGWDELAKKLQDEGYAVLAFDFRGHDRSTAVSPKEFWIVRINQGLRGFNPARLGSDISFKDFPPRYLPMLVNDIEAAKHFLDQQNDAGLCNSSSLIVLGAKDGATLGALWMALQYQTPILAKDAFGRLVIQGVRGEDLACGVWLSISPYIGTQQMAVANWFAAAGLPGYPAMREKVPMYLLCTEGNNNKGFCEQLRGVLKLAGKSKVTDLDYVKVFPGKEAQRLAGKDLLGLGADKFIIKYLDTVLQNGGNPWQMKRVETKRIEPLPIGKLVMGF